MIEMLHAAELARDLLDDPDILGTHLMADKGDRREEAVGVIEAPRGTLFHHYRVDEDDLVTYCNLIVSTTNNNQAMNESIRSVATQHLNGHEITEGLLNHIEIAIRAYDPCLSCATHAIGQMPLEVELVDAAGALVSRGRKNYGGTSTRILSPCGRRGSPKGEADEAASDGQSPSSAHVRDGPPSPARGRKGRTACIS